MFTDLSDTGKASVYYTIAFLLCCGVALLGSQIGPRTTTVAMFTPLAAVLLTLLVVTRDGYSKRAWLDLGISRAGASLWPLAVAIPIAALSLAYALVWMSGMATLAVPPNFAVLPAVLDFAVSLTVVALTAGIGEEIGWRGYLLPHLLALGPRKAALLSGFLHGVFHLPVLLGTPYYHAGGNPWITVPLFLTTLTLAGVCYGYLRIASASIWPVAIAHSTFNIMWDRLNTFTASGSPLALEYLAGESGVLTIVALAVVALWLLRYRFPK